LNTLESVELCGAAGRTFHESTGDWQRKIIGQYSHDNRLHSQYETDNDVPDTQVAEFPFYGWIG
jgi:hypothetical protein